MTRKRWPSGAAAPPPKRPCAAPNRPPPCSRRPRKRPSSCSANRTILPLDDCLYTLQEAIPHLSRSALPRCFQRHGISRLPPSEELGETTKKQFKDYPIGYLRVGFTEVQTEEGTQYLFIAIDRTSKLAFAELHPQATQVIAVEFLRRVLPQLPYKVHKLLSNNEI